MATIANQILTIKYVVSTGSAVPCVGNSRGIDMQARLGATFDCPITLTYNVGGRPTTIGATVPIKDMEYIKDIDPMTEMLETTISGPQPDQGAQCTCTIKITTTDGQGNPINVTNTTTTVVPIQFA